MPTGPVDRRKHSNMKSCVQPAISSADGEWRKVLLGFSSTAASIIFSLNFSIASSQKRASGFAETNRHTVASKPLPCKKAGMMVVSALKPRGLTWGGDHPLPSSRGAHLLSARAQRMRTKRASGLLSSGTGN